MHFFSLPRKEVESIGGHWNTIPVLIFSAICLFSVTHTPLQLLQKGYESLLISGVVQIYVPQSIRSFLESHTSNVLQFLVTFRGIIFFFGLLVLSIPIYTSIYHFIKSFPHGTIYASGKKSIAAISILSLFVFPIRLGIMGEGYSLFSLDPFATIDNSFQLYQRILMPAVAYFLQFKGEVLYWIFSFFLTFIFLIFIQLLFYKKDVPLSVLEIVSIGTSSFLLTQFQSPGYPDILSFLLLTVLIIVPTSMQARFALVALMLLAHEGNALILLPYCILLFQDRERVLSLQIIVIYALIWFIAFRGDIESILAIRTVGSKSGFQWVVEHPVLYISGALISFKMLWLLIFVGLRSMADSKRISLYIFLTVIVLSLAAVDTSRLFGYAFPILFYALFAIKKFSLIEIRTYRTILVLNILIPSVYIGVNSGLVTFDGMYQFILTGVLMK